MVNYYLEVQTMAKTILIIEDEEAIQGVVKAFLEDEGYNVVLASDGLEGMEKFRECHPDLILLDLMLPGIDGYQVCREVRSKSNIPIIMLSARGEEYDKLFGFELGIDDYVVKPFSPKELMARVNAVLSRRKAAAPAAQEIMKFDGLEINIPARTVTVDGNKVELTPKEYELLFYLVKNKNIALSRDKLLSDIWGYDFFGDDRTIDTHIKNLRNNLGPYRDFIVTLRGVGYKFEYEN